MFWMLYDDGLELMVLRPFSTRAVGQAWAGCGTRGPYIITQALFGVFGIFTPPFASFLELSAAPHSGAVF